MVESIVWPQDWVKGQYAVVRREGHAATEVEGLVTHHPVALIDGAFSPTGQHEAPLVHRRLFCDPDRGVAYEICKDRHRGGKLMVVLSSWSQFHNIVDHLNGMQNGLLQTMLFELEVGYKRVCKDTPPQPCLLWRHPEAVWSNTEREIVLPMTVISLVTILVIFVMSFLAEQV